MTHDNATEPVIRVRDLHKRYGQTRAVDGVGFDVRAGEVFGLLRPNGAGKTTTVEILEGLRKPDSGEVRVLGIDVARNPDALKERIGVALQTAALYPKLTVVEVLDLFRSFYPKGRASSELIDLLELGEKRSSQAQALSGGQRQRLAPRGRPAHAADVPLRRTPPDDGRWCGLQPLWVCFAVLIGFLGICFAISARFFRWQ